MKIKITFLFFFITQMILAQEYTYEVSLVPMEIPQLGGIQSYSFAQHDGEWLIIGGRLDGLHQRQPFAAFDETGNNTQIIVVNPGSMEVWKSSVTNLPSNLKEQLSSTNMQFYQDEEYLIITGGYAFSNTAEDHITFPNITAIHIAELIQNVKNDNVQPNNFIQLIDEKFAVTGGALEKIEDTFYLVGGHRFDGRYNPMGPNMGPGFFQEYTNEIRPFNININNNQLTVEHLPSIHDEMHLHRRDYNLMPQIVNGKEELMIFSGVFQPTSDIPWLYPVSITENGYLAHEDFIQHFNHYQCASIPIYNESSDEMHNIFFGGIAQFYMDNGVMVQDNDVPFVNTIADVSRSSNAEFKETILSSTMPDLLGAGSEFILNNDVNHFENGVIKGDDMDTNETEVGYIYGGIRSSAPNIFFINDGTQSQTWPTIYKVLLSKVDNTSAVENMSAIDKSLLIYPNPTQNISRLSINIPNPSDITIEVYDTIGQLIGTQLIPKSELKAGKNFIVLNKFDVKYGTYIYKLNIGSQQYVRRVIWSE